MTVRSKTEVYYFEHTGGVPSPQSRKIEGKRFGKLVALYPVGKSKCQHIVWRFICDCGNYYDAMPRNLSEKSSCGCIINLAGEDSRGWRGIGTLTGRYISSCIHGAKARNLEWNLTKEYLWGLYETQNGNCSLSGVPIVFAPNAMPTQTASLDRIDSSKGYTEDNVQWVHKKINQIKMDLSQEEFIELCRNVVSYQETKCTY